MPSLKKEHQKKREKRKSKPQRADFKLIDHPLTN